IRTGDVRFLHVVSAVAALGAQLCLAGAGVCGSRTEGIWRAGAEGVDHRRSRAGMAGADLRRVLPDSGWRGVERLVSGRVAVELESTGKFCGRGHLRRDGNDLVLVVYLSAAARKATLRLTVSN